MNTAKQNIILLPDYCFGKLPEDNSVIRIYAGEMGYTRLNSQPPLNGQNVDDFINEANAEMGITIPQRMAMEHGSMFGWGTGGADPDTYNEDGSFKL